MKVSFLGETYDCTKAVKNGANATLYLSAGGAVEFRGVGSWDLFTLEDGDWSLPEVTEQQQLRADVDFIAIMMGVVLT